MNTPTRSIAALAAAALLGVGIWSGLHRSARPRVSNTAAPAATVYSDAALGFRVTLPPGWNRLTDSGFNGDAVFQSTAAQGCGCAVYVTRESNAARLDIAAWLVGVDDRKDTYISRQEYDRRRRSTDPGERALAGTFKQSDVVLAGAPAVRQEYASEGGGYVRYLVLRDRSVFVLTLWSDSYYFTDIRRQNGFDGDQLGREVDAMVASLVFFE